MGNHATPQPSPSPSPYYSDEFVTLYHGDCLAVTPWLQADVLVSDVPYGIAYRSNQRRVSLPRSIANDLDTGVRDAAVVLWRREGTPEVDMDRPALIFGSWKKPRPVGTRALLVWDTKGALGMGAMDLPWKPSHQEIYVLGKGFHGPRTTDVLTVAPVQSLGYNGRQHPHEKPVALMAELIRKCPPGVVADPFAGSGSTLIAAAHEGRKAIGVEEDEYYCEVIAKRLQNRDHSLFGGVA